MSFYANKNCKHCKSGLREHCSLIGKKGFTIEDARACTFRKNNQAEKQKKASAESAARYYKELYADPVKVEARREYYREYCKRRYHEMKKKAVIK